MENKKVLGKILPAVLVLVFALLLVITISSCSKARKTPVGAIEDKDGYLKINLSDDETYSISKLDFYNKLRYVGYSSFEDALFGAALTEYVDDIKADIEKNSANLEASKYYKKFKYVIDKEVYGTADQDEIDDFEDDEKLVNEKKYLNNIKQIGYDVDNTTNIYQKASFEYQLINLAKREYARKCLLEEIEDEDSENQISDKKIEDFFSNKITYKGNISALLILFSSQTEIEEALMQLNLKFVGNKLYRVSAKDAKYEDASNPKFSEYEEYYKDFDNTKDGVSALDDNEVLFELCRVYNYIYSYRNKLTFVVNGVNYLDETTYAVDPLTDSNYTDVEYKAIKETKLDDMVTLLLAQDLGDFKTSPRLNYDFKTLKQIDSSLQQGLYNSYLFNSDEKPRYNTPSSTFARGNYLAFKLVDDYTGTYKSVKALADLEDAVANNGSEAVIKACLESIKEEYKDIIRGLGLKSNDEIKTWALQYAKDITLFKIQGAKDIIASATKNDDDESIWAKVFEEMLTDDYIKEKLNDYLDDECKITIYDSLFEVQFAQKYDFYKAGNKSSKELVLKVKVGDNEYKVTALEMFEKLEKKYGANTSISLLSNQILKEKYYDKITDAKKKEYEEEYDNIISYFAQGKSADYGYSASIGQNAFVNLYFQADNKEEAIFNMWASAELQSILIYQNATDFKSDLYSLFNTLTNIEAESYVNIEYNLIHVYTDDDEDGEPDDWTKVDDTDPRKQEVKELAAELINIINERAMNEYSNTDRNNAYNSLYSKYQSASRISKVGYYGVDSIPSEGFASTSEQDAFYFAKFKAKGLFLGEDVSKLVSSVSELLEIKDDNYEEQIKNCYTYMIKNHSDDLKVDQIIAKKLNLNDEGQQIGGGDITKAAADELVEFKKGYATFYIINTTKAPSFKFEVTDNSDTPTGGKVYPYSIDEDDPFPKDEDNKPLDNTGKPESLYNTTDKVTDNQILIYIRESKDGVESLSTSVLDGFKAYFQDRIMANYTSNNFRYYISLTLINQKISEGKITIEESLLNEIKDLVECKSAAIFNFEESALATEWYNLFK